MSSTDWQDHGCASLADLFGDNVIWRGLQPMDPALPGLRQLNEQLGISPNCLPRKTSLEYARVVHSILQAAPLPVIKQLVFIGDTLFNDGCAFHNLCEVSGWQGAAFIGAEDRSRLPLLQWKPNPHRVERLFTANRWKLLDEFAHVCAVQGFQIDRHTLAIFDLDKTAIGARGRNDSLIDLARLQAAFFTARECFSSFDEQYFQQIYDTLNTAYYHPITTDNQDYLVFICIFLYAGLPSMKTFLQAVQDNKIRSFADSCDMISTQADRFSVSLAELNHGFMELLNAGDPTPFKRFREIEYENTVRLMQAGVSVNPAGRCLQEAIVMTAEVKAFAEQCREQGATLFALSDKPDEASTPPAVLQQSGWQPLHRVAMRVIGA